MKNNHITNSDKVKEWRSDASLPKGWMLKETFTKIAGKTKKEARSYTYLQAPGGNVFFGRRQALVFIRERSWDPEEVKIMRQGLSEEGWEDHALLPDGWKTKVKPNPGKLKNNKEFLTKDMDIISGCKNAINHISSHMSKDDLDNFQIFTDNLTKDGRITNYEWFEDETLPEGWKSRGNKSGNGHPGGNFFILAPTKEQFTARRMALKFMVDNGHPDKEVEIMRENLSRDGWQDHSLLPSKWKMRISDQKDEDKKLVERRVYFLSENALFFKNFLEVQNHMKELGSYSEEQKDRINKLSLDETRTLRQDFYDWVCDDDLPSGWKKRTSDCKTKRMSFLSPQGESFGTRKSMLKHLVLNQENENIINKLKETLKHEGFNPHHLLPKGWMVKQRKNSKQLALLFLTQNMEELKGSKKAFEFLKKDSNFSQYDIEMFREFEKEQSVLVNANFYEWSEDCSLPRGWKTRCQDGGRVLFLTRNKEVLKSKRRAYVYLIKHNYPLYDIEAMRASLVSEGIGWKESGLLPPGWIYTDKDVGKGRMMHFLDSEGQEFKSMKSVIYTLTNNDKYTLKNNENMKIFIRNNFTKKMSGMKTWEDSNTIPSGWKIRNNNNLRVHKTEEGSSSFTWLLSPNGEEFMTRKVAFQHMVSQRYPAEEIEEMRGHLRHEGWRQDPNLPLNWLFKELSSIQTLFLTAAGEELRSPANALDHLKKNQDHSEKEFDNLKIFVAHIMQKMKSLMQERTKVKASENWRVDENISSRWKTKLGEHSKYKKQLYLAPDGKQFSSRIKTYQHMLHHSFPNEEIEAMKKQVMQFDDWQENEKLPEGWLYRDHLTFDVTGTCQPLSKFWLITDKGKMLRGIKEATVFMVDSDSYDHSDILALKSMCDQLSTDKKELKTDWKDTHSLPKGWTVKSDGVRQSFLSSSGETFPSRRECLSFVTSYGYPSFEIEKIRSSLRLDGWQESPSLPEGWRYKKMGEDCLGGYNTYYLCTKQGELLSNLKEARKHFVDNGKDQEGLDAFFKTKSKKNGQFLLYSWLDGDDTVPVGWKMKPGTKMF